MNKKVLFFTPFILYCALSCRKSEEGLRFIRPKETTVFHALNKLEGPKSIIPLTNEKETELFTWNDFNLQVKKNIVSVKFRYPKDDEVFLVYWEKKYPYSEKAITQIEDSQFKNRKLYQYRIIASKESIIYDPFLDRVVRIVEY